jgi:SAM-dependent methyltransferase
MPTLDGAANLLGLFADPTRVRLVSLLARHELTVSELTSITQLAQSRVSTHLGKLREADVLRDRRVGASTFYALNDATMPDEARKLWSLVAAEVKDDVLASDAERCDAALRAREKTAPWPDSVAGEMDRHYSPGRTWESLARGMLGLVRLGDVLDVGCGDGAMAQLLAPRAKSYTCIDRSDKMIAAARARLHETQGVRFVVGDAQELPEKDARFDDVLLFNVLTHVPTPARVLSEAARVLRPRGRVAIVTLAEHDQEAVTAAYHHQNAGFKPAHLKKLLQKAGLVVERCEITSRERREPHFQVISAFAEKPAT